MYARFSLMTFFSVGGVNWNMMRCACLIMSLRNEQTMYVATHDGGEGWFSVLSQLYAFFVSSIFWYVGMHS